MSAMVGIGGVGVPITGIPLADLPGSPFQDRLAGGKQSLEVLEKQAADLRKSNEELQKQVSEAECGPLSEDKKQEIKAKDQKISALKQEYEELRKEQRLAEDPNQKGRTELQALESQHAKLRLELQEARAGPDHTEANLLAGRISREEQTERVLKGQLQRLESNSYLSKSGIRREVSRRATELEEQLKKKNADHEGLMSSHMQAEEMRLNVRQEKQRMEQRCGEMRVQNVKFQTDAESQANEMLKIEQQIRLMRERLPPEGQEALERALSSMLGDQAAAFARVTDRSPPALMPNASDLLSTESMTRVLEQLRSERDELARQMQAVREDISREAATSRHLKAMQMQELEDRRLKLRTHLLDREKWERIAAAHLHTIHDYQKKIATLDRAQGLALGDGDWGDAASSAGFSDLSDLEGFDENALDVCVVEAELDPSTVTRLEQALGTGNLSSEHLRSVVCVELRGFDAAYSAVATGLRPVYSSMVSFGPFFVNDVLLDQLAEGSIGVELHGSFQTSDQQRLLGKGSQPLAPLLTYAEHDKRNPVAFCAVLIRDANDFEVIVARVRLKLRLRYPVEELVEDYKHRMEVYKSDKQHLRRDLDRNLEGKPQRLCVQIRRVSGLPPAQRQQPQQLRPYLFYQFPGHPPHFTKTGQGSHPDLGEIAYFTLTLDAQFCKWVETGGGLHFIVFDDVPMAALGPTAAGATAMAMGAERRDERALGLHSEARVSLRPLIHSAHAVVEGTFTLRKDLVDPTSAAMGAIDIRIFWQEFAGREAFAGTPAVMSDVEYEAILGRLVRRLAAKGVQTVENAFDHFDVERDGAIRRDHFMDGMVRMQLGISDDEAMRLFSRLDADGDGKVVLTEFRAALAKCTQADAPQREQEAWARELFDSIRQAIDRRKDISAEALFRRLAQESGRGGGAGLGTGIDRPSLNRLLRAFRSDLTDAHLERLWLMIDKDRNGLLSFEEFADIFGHARALVQSAAGTGPMSEEYFGILVGRLLRRLKDRGVQTIEQVIQLFDRNLDGRLERRELETALIMEAPNLSQFERVQFAARMDTDNDGVITVAELKNAFSMVADVSTQALQRGEVISARIRNAIARSSHSPQDVFNTLCKGLGVMRRLDFQELVKQFAPDLDLPSVELMWQLVDKNSDGALVYDEFARFFAPTAAHAFAGTPGDEYFGILAGRWCRKLKDSGFGTVEAVIRDYDLDRDGRLSVAELETAMARHAPNLSREERAEFAKHVDADRDGIITAQEIQAALELGEKAYGSAEKRIQEIFGRIRASIARAGHSLPQLFKTLCRSHPDAMFQQEFYELLSTFEKFLDRSSMLLAWQTIDKNNDGALVYQEFAQYFGQGAAAVSIGAALTEEYFGIVSGRWLKRLKKMGFTTLEAVMQRCDQDGDGRLSCKELELAMARDAPNLSQTERAQFAERVDADRDGIISTQDLMNALTSGERVLAQAEQRATDLFGRIRAAMARSGHRLPDLFASLCKSTPGLMNQAEFVDLVAAFDKTIDSASLILMWQVVDKNNDGGLVYEEFAQHFGATAPAPGALVEAAATGTLTTATPPMSDEYFGITAGRLLKRLKALNILTVELACQRFDQDRDGRLTVKELEVAMQRDAPNLSQIERAQFAERVDSDRNGLITTQELEAALRRGEAVYSAAERRASELFARIQGAISRSGHALPQLFQNLCKSRPGMMLQPEFSELVGTFDRTVDPASSLLMWQVLDKNNDGALVYEEFARHFTQQPAPFGSTLAQSLVASTVAPLAPPMSDEYFGIIAGRLLKRLKALNILTVEMACQRFDQDRDGRLTVKELELALQRDAPNLSQFERAQFAERVDANRDGLITTQELDAALRRGDLVYSQAEKRATELITRIRSAISRSTHTLPQLFASLCKTTPGKMVQQEFNQLIGAFDATVDPASLALIWQFVDKNNDGTLVYEEFSQNFSPHLHPSALATPSQASGLTSPTPAPMSDDYFGIIAGRLLKKLKALNILTVEMAVQRFDQDRDGRLTVSELEVALQRDAPNLSQVERAHFAQRVDADRNGIITTQELDAALRRGDLVYGQAEKRANELFNRIQSAISRSGHALPQLFANLCKSRPGNLLQHEFEQFVRTFDATVDPASLLIMWQFVDKNSDGALAYEEFVLYFSPAVAPAVPVASSTGLAPLAPLPPAALAPLAPAAPLAPPAPVAPQMSDEYFGIIAGRLLKRLKACNIPTVEMAVQRFDHDRDGRLTVKELEMALQRDAPNLSPYERAQFAERVDSDRNGIITTQELDAALRRGDVTYATAERKAAELFARIRAAISRGAQALPQLFMSLCKTKPGMMLETDFRELVGAFDRSVDPASLLLMWQLVDKNCDGALVYEEFAQHFSPSVASPAVPALVAAAPLNQPSPLGLASPLAAPVGVPSAPSMSDDHFGILAGRLLKRFKALNILTVEMAVQRFDLNRNGRLMTRELEVALQRDTPNLSQAERADFAQRVDADRDGVISTRELDNALRLGETTYARAQQRASELFARIHGSIARSHHTLPQVFESLVKSRYGVMSQAQFNEILTHYDKGLDQLSLQLLWQIVDKTNEGALVYEEFARCFSSTPALVAPPAPTAALPAALPTAPGTVSALAPHQAQPLPAIPGPAVPQMSEEHFGILAGRLLRKLKAFGIQTVEMAVQRFDQDRDGRLTRTELEIALSRDAPNLSHTERVQFAERVDADRDGIITTRELDAALSLGHTVYAQAERRASEIFARIRGTMDRSGQRLQDIFNSLCKTQAGIMRQNEFNDLVNLYERALDPGSLQLLWQLVDKNHDGALVYEEFARCFQQALPPAATAAPIGQPAPLGVASLPAAPVGVPGAPPLSEDYFGILAGRLLKRLKAVNIPTVEMAIQRFDINRNGRLMTRELEAALQRDVPNLSQVERAQFAQQIDSDRDGVITTRELDNALRVGDTIYSRAQQRAAELFARIQGSITQSNHTLPQVFESLVKSRYGVMSQAQFSEILTHYDKGLDQLSLQLLWQIVDKTDAGALVYEEFARCFTPSPTPVAPPPGPTAAVLPAVPLAAVGVTPQAAVAQPGVPAVVAAQRPSAIPGQPQQLAAAQPVAAAAVGVAAPAQQTPLSEEYFGILAGRLLRKLQALQIQSMDVAFRHFNQNRDGRLTCVEMETGLTRELPGLSQVERAQFAARINVSRTGFITTDELQAALTTGDATYRQVEQRTLGFFQSVGSAVVQAGYTLQHLFQHMCKSSAGMMMQAEFNEFVLHYCQGVDSVNLSLMWQIVDKNAQGSLVLAEFEARFRQAGAQAAAPAPAQAAAVPAPPVASAVATPGLAQTQPAVAPVAPAQAVATPGLAPQQPGLAPLAPPQAVATPGLAPQQPAVALGQAAPVGAAASSLNPALVAKIHRLIENRRETPAKFFQNMDFMRSGFLNADQFATGLAVLRIQEEKPELKKFFLQLEGCAAAGGRLPVTRIAQLLAPPGTVATPVVAAVPQSRPIANAQPPVVAASVASMGAAQQPAQQPAPLATQAPQAPQATPQQPAQQPDAASALLQQIRENVSASFGPPGVVQLFEERCSPGRVVLAREDFEQKIARSFDPALRPEVAVQLWKAVAGDANAQVISLSQFCEQFCPEAMEVGVPTLTSSSNPNTQLWIYLERLDRRLKAQNATVQQIFSPFDQSRRSELSFEDFVRACSQVQGLGVSRLEAEFIFFRLTGIKKGAPLQLDRGIHFRTLELSMKGAVQPVDAESRWAQTTLLDINHRLLVGQPQGPGLEAVFAQQPAVDVREVQKEFNKHLQLEKEQWATLLAFIPKMPDGRALWPDLLRWAGVAK